MEEEKKIIINEFFNKIMINASIIFLISTGLSILFGFVEDYLVDNNYPKWAEHAINNVSTAFATIAAAALTGALYLYFNKNNNNNFINKKL